jgi:hypothetical protein
MEFELKKGCLISEKKCHNGLKSQWQSEMALWALCFGLLGHKFDFESTTFNSRATIQGFLRYTF